MLKNLIPNLLHFLDFSEKAVASYVKIIPTILRGARETASCRGFTIRESSSTILSAH